ncbi:hypothetical protein [Winogradskyella sp.]|uniref:hypothetical protein n=1 Tax=Winogradskyella sp. TaxID=1883156 RepID=UPI00260ED4A3|nr:hypothetical protein [Winogradskyella sp.]
MKRTLLFLVFAFCLNYAFSQKLIAVQNGGEPDFYEDVDEAFTNAIEGDTLYFPGGSFNVNRSIYTKFHIIGVGHNPDNTSSTGSTIFSSSNPDLPQLQYFTGGGGSVTGIAFTNVNAQGNIVVNSDIDGLVIDRVNLPNGFNCVTGVVKNLFMTKSITDRIDIREINGILPSGTISNNIINWRSHYFTNLTIENNIFLTNDSNWLNSTRLMYANNCNVINNIFNVGMSGRIIPSSTNSSFRNNFGLGGSTITSNSNFLSNNLLISNLTFNDIFSNYISNNISLIYESDLHLVDNSPLLTAANDGGQIGIYGGRFPWKDGSVPFNPHIVSKNISGSTNENGDLPVEIEVEAQQN